MQVRYPSHSLVCYLATGKVKKEKKEVAGKGRRNENKENKSSYPTPACGLYVPSPPQNFILRRLII